MSDVPDTQVVVANMQQIMDSIVQVFADNDVMLPDRRFLTTQKIVHDCEQLAIELVQLYNGPPGAEAEQPQRCEVPRTMVLSIELVRCIPKSTRSQLVPAVEDLEQTAAQQSADAWLLMDGAMASMPANFLGALGDVSMGEPSGGYQAVILNFVTGVT